MLNILSIKTPFLIFVLSFFLLQIICTTTVRSVNTTTPDLVSTSHLESSQDANIQKRKWKISNFNNKTDESILKSKPQNTDLSDQKNTVKNLTKHLSCIDIPSAVKNLVKTGKEQYKNTKTGLKNARNGSVGGGRKPTWIMDTFRETENAIISKLEKIPAPPTWTIEQIDNAYQAQISQKKSPLQPDKTPTFFIARGVGVNYLHESPLGDNSILQLASQFNYLEATSPYNKTKVSEYLTD